MTPFDIPTDWWDQLRATYPKRGGDNGWIAVRTLVPRRLTEGFTWNQILDGTKAYAAHCRKAGLEHTALVKQAQTFYGPTAWFAEWQDMDTRNPAQILAEQRVEAAVKRAQELGFRARRDAEPPEVYASCLRDFERENTRTVGQPKFAIVK